MEPVNISILRRLELKGEAFTNFEMSSKGFTQGGYGDYGRPVGLAGERNSLKNLKSWTAARLTWD